MCDASLYLGHLLLHTPPKLRPEPGLVQLFCGRVRQIEPARSVLGIVQLSIRVPMIVSVMAYFDVPRLCVIGRFIVPLRFVLLMLFAVTIPTLLRHARQTIMRASSL
jgi:hypothetical protein